jgi:hypothetical protein
MRAAEGDGQLECSSCGFKQEKIAEVAYEQTDHD